MALQYSPWIKRLKPSRGLYFKPMPATRAELHKALNKYWPYINNVIAAKKDDELLHGLIIFKTIETAEKALRALQGKEVNSRAVLHLTYGKKKLKDRPNTPIPSNNAKSRHPRLSLWST